MESNRIFYNVWEEPWIEVEYLNGEIKDISISQAFNDALIIKDIATPVFHDNKYCFNRMAALQFLIVLLMASLNDGVCEDDDITYNERLSSLVNGTELTEFTNNYFKKDKNRFDLFDNIRPFLQDIKIKDSDLEPNKSFNTQIDPVAPGANNLLIGRERKYRYKDKDTIANYDISLKEAVYYLLQNASISGTTCGAQYPSAADGNADIFVFVKGKNLKETLLLNCIWQTEDIKIGHPIWDYDYNDPDASLDNLFNLGLAENCKIKPIDNLLLNEYNQYFKPIYIKPEISDDGNLVEVFIPTCPKILEIHQNDGHCVVTGKSSEKNIDSELNFGLDGKSKKKKVNKKSDAYFKIRPLKSVNSISYKSNENDVSFVTFSADKEAFLTILSAANNFDKDYGALALRNEILRNYKEIGGNYDLEFFIRSRDDHKTFVQNAFTVTMQNVSWIHTEKGHAVSMAYEAIYPKVRNALSDGVMLYYRNGEYTLSINKDEHNKVKKNKYNYSLGGDIATLSDDFKFPSKYIDLKEQVLMYFSEETNNYLKNGLWNENLTEDQMIENAKQFLYEKARSIYESRCYKIKDLMSFVLGLKRIDKIRPKILVTDTDLINDSNNTTLT